MMKMATRKPCGTVSQQKVGTIFPGLSPEQRISALIKVSEHIACSLFEIMLINEAAESVAEMLAEDHPDASTLYLSFCEDDQQCLEAHNALKPAVSAVTILKAYSHLTKSAKGMSASKITYNSLILLFEKMAATHLLSEKRRYLRSLAVLVSLHPTAFRHESIIRTLLRELMDLVKEAALRSTVLHMIDWGLLHISIKAQKDDAKLSALVIRTLRQLAHHSGSSEVDAWIAIRAPVWVEQTLLKECFPSVLPLWPAEWRDTFEALGITSVEDPLVLVRERPASSALILAKAIRQINTDSAGTAVKDERDENQFWDLKATLPVSDWDADGARALLDIVYSNGARVHIPNPQTCRAVAVDETVRALSTRFRDEPRVLHQASMFYHLLHLEQESPSVSLRTRVRKCLQALSDSLSILNKRGALAPSAANQLALLLHFPSSESSEISGDDDVDFGVGFDASHPDGAKSWSTSLASSFCITLSATDPSYAQLLPLLRHERTAADILIPFITQAYLTPNALCATEDRQKKLGDYFTKILQTKSSSLSALEGIIRIVLHLRHYNPPQRSESSLRSDASTLNFIGWLDLDYLSLCEAGLRCKEFTTALLFLDLANESATGPNALDLSDPRVQQVCLLI